MTNQTRHLIESEGFQCFRCTPPRGTGWYRLHQAAPFLSHDDRVPRVVWLVDLFTEQPDHFGQEPFAYMWGWDPTDDPEALESSWDLDTLYWKRIVQP